MATRRVKIGVVGYGSLGQFMVKKIVESSDLELSFVWNRSVQKIEEDAAIDPQLILRDLNDFAKFPVDFIVEVAHPQISKTFGEQFVHHANYFIGSPTAFADFSTEKKLRTAAEANTSGHGVFIPTGAFWGVQDIVKMSKSGTLSGLSVTMKKHPSSLKVEGSLVEKLEAVITNKLEGEVVIYEGNVRSLCPLAPNNVNTMAVASLAASCLGLDGVVGRLVVDCNLQAHVIEIEATGVKNKDGQQFSVKTVRHNPAPPGAVTGTATYLSFFNSLLEAATSRPKIVNGVKTFEFHGNGFHFC